MEVILVVGFPRARWMRMYLHGRTSPARMTTHRHVAHHHRVRTIRILKFFHWISYKAYRFKN